MKRIQTYFMKEDTQRIKKIKNNIERNIQI